jgi:hypothetical protein
MPEIELLISASLGATDLLFNKLVTADEPCPGTEPNAVLAVPAICVAAPARLVNELAVVVIELNDPFNDPTVD